MSTLTFLEGSLHPFGGIPSFDQYEITSPFNGGQLPNDLVMNAEPLQQWFPRATLLADYTVDWNYDENEDQIAVNARTNSYSR